MAQILFKHGEYVASALQGSNFPVLRSPNGDLLPEIAFVGRSNVGKSSLINHLLGSTGLARVSSTPGKTQMINFFAIDQSIALVDLPGYGYAKVPKEMRKSWAVGLENYFAKRETLHLILLLLDIRRTPGEEDLMMATWCAHRKQPLMIVFTKSDKLLQKDRQRAVDASLEKFHSIDALQLKPHVIYSTKDHSKRDHLIYNINQALLTR
ncbi:MAG: YihA family ribosome biogenesis GTP-binding protein [Anaplasmataceae bacterium]|nr:YihA family ribosome biogenesis GTP-binding protein [Anaplasmataceae bacterium]